MTFCRSGSADGALVPLVFNSEDSSHKDFHLSIVQIKL